MKTVRRLLYRDIVSAVVFVGLAFLSLFFFIDLVDQLDSVGQRGRTVAVAVLTALLALPGHGYELMPIAVLIGTIYALARLAQSSEFTILRTGGLGPKRALLLLAVLGAAFALLTFVLGDIVAPVSERQAVLLKARAGGGLNLSGPGAWLKERAQTSAGTQSVSVKVGGLNADGTLREVRIYAFDAQGRLAQRLSAPHAVVGDAAWRLEDAQSLTWPADGAGAVLHRHDAQRQWPTTLDARVVAAALLPAETMTTLELWRYSRHLQAQEQSAQRYELQFWKRALYPLACVVMVALALPFAYLSSRAGGVSLKVFGGIMLGIAFVLLNNVAGHIGVLSGLTPWMVSAAPPLLFLLLSLAAFAWLVRYR
jgi:lipopolysaccharide export system permease protein